VALVVLLNLEGPLSARMKASLREVVAPLQEAVFSGTRKVSEATRAVRAFGDLVKQNEAMSAELVELRNEVLTLKGLEQENIDLRQQMLYARQAERRLVSCPVIARDVSGWWQTVRLGKGYLDGVEAEMAVITPEGLVGKTMDVSPRTADVLLISDPSCKVSVEIGRIEAFGIFSGRGPTEEGRATGLLEFISKNADVREEDEIVTSGLGGVFPKGLLVGHVRLVEPDSSGLSQSASVLAAAQVIGLTQVFVVVEERDRVGELLLERSRDGEALR
jgi:rod shape-determining protein MreC